MSASQLMFSSSINPYFSLSPKRHSQQAVSRTALTVTVPSDTAIKALRLKSHVIVWLRQRSHFLLHTPPQLPLIVPQGSLTETQTQTQTQNPKPAPAQAPAPAPALGPAGLVVVPGEAGSSLLRHSFSNAMLQKIIQEVIVLQLRKALNRK